MFQSLELKIRNLNADVDQRDQNIDRLQKEKKQLEQINQQTLEDLQAMEDKANHLGKLKIKLEQQIEDVSASLSNNISNSTTNFYMTTPHVNKLSCYGEIYLQRNTMNHLSYHTRKKVSISIAPGPFRTSFIKKYCN